MQISFDLSYCLLTQYCYEYYSCDVGLGNRSTAADFCESRAKNIAFLEYVRHYLMSSLLEIHMSSAEFLWT